MKRSSFIAGTAGCLAAVWVPPGAARGASGLDAYMLPHVRMAEFRGVVSVAPSGTNASVAAYGARFGAATRFRVASIAKTFTAATVDRLAATGAIRIDDPLGKYLPAFSKTAITLRQLLDHESGIPDIYSLPEFARGHAEPVSREDYIRLLADARPQFQPGQKSSYSNSGYSLLAFAVEEAANAPFASVQKRFLIDPLGLSDTGVLPGANVVPGFDPGAPNALRAAEPIDPSWLIGNGSLYSSAADLTRWLAEVRAGKLVRTRAWPYPWGWGRKANGQVLDADGRYAGYACDALLDLRTGDAVVVLSAVQSAVVDKIAGDVLASLHGRKLIPQAVRTIVPLGASANAHYAGMYRLSADFAVTVRAFGDALQVAGPDGVFEALDPLGNDRFYFRVLDTGLTFKRGADGSVAALDWGPGSFTLTRVPPEGAVRPRG